VLHADQAWLEQKLYLQIERAEITRKEIALDKAEKALKAKQDEKWQHHESAPNDPHTHSSWKDAGWGTPKRTAPTEWEASEQYPKAQRTQSDKPDPAPDADTSKEGSWSWSSWTWDNRKTEDE
jgi:hypothetical protein